jgi:hypothetical protein
VDPRGSGEAFTDAGAWEFVVMLLESGHPTEVVELKQPPGRKGYVMKVDGAAGQPKIYIKLQLGSGRVLGRSFHESTVP